MTNKKVLIITYYWPPAGGPGVQRVLKFVKYLPQFGWEPIILTVKDGEYQAVDESLESDIIETLKVFKTRVIGLYSLYKKFTGRKTIPTHQLSGGKNDSLFSRLSRWIRLNIILPDGRIGWYPFAVAGGRKIIENEKVDLIFSSGPPHSLHLIARSLAKKYSIPWVADFRDPWTERFYYEENVRSFFAKKVDLYLEKNILTHANRITTVSSGLKTLLEQKVNPLKIEVIYNGYDETDFKTSPIEKTDNSTIISSIGTLSRTQTPNVLFKAIEELRNEGLTKSIYLHFAGTIHSAIRDDINDRYHLNDITTYHGYLSHTDAIEMMRNSDFLMLVVPKTKNNVGIITGKLFEYLRAATPIILIGPLDSDAAKILHETQTGFIIGYDNVSEIKNILLNPPQLVPVNIDRYTRENLTKQLSDVFNECC